MATPRVDEKIAVEPEAASVVRSETDLIFAAHIGTERAGPPDTQGRSGKERIRSLVVWLEIDPLVFPCLRLTL